MGNLCGPGTTKKAQAGAAPVNVSQSMNENTNNLLQQSPLKKEPKGTTYDSVEVASPPVVKNLLETKIDAVVDQKEVIDKSY